MTVDDIKVENTRLAIFLKSKGFEPIYANVNTHVGAKNDDYIIWINKNVKEAIKNKLHFMSNRSILNHDDFDNWLLSNHTDK